MILDCSTRLQIYQRMEDARNDKYQPTIMEDSRNETGLFNLPADIPKKC